MEVNPVTSRSYRPFIYYFLFIFYPLSLLLLATLHPSDSSMPPPDFSTRCEFRFRSPRIPIVCYQKMKNRAWVSNVLSQAAAVTATTVSAHTIHGFLFDFTGFSFKMTTAIAIEDVRREVKILRALTRHNNLFLFIKQVVRREFIVYFNKIFDALCKLSADSDSNVQSAAHLLDRLMKVFIKDFEFRLSCLL